MAEEEYKHNSMCFICLVMTEVIHATVNTLFN